MKNKVKISIITPVFNDWESAQKLINEINNKYSSTSQVNILIIDDGSTHKPSIDIPHSKNIKIEIIRLKTNIGHQRAIMIGLCVCHEKYSSNDFVIVMDADGEDDPSYIEKLIKKSSSEKKIIFAARNKRSETFRFKLSYLLYKIVFRFLTGKSIYFGNYSCIPSLYLERICYDHNFWNHYSSSIMVSKIPYSSIKTDRRKRFDGNSKMSSINLIIHGLSSISVYIETVIYRLVVFLVIITSLLIIISLALVYLKLFTYLTIPGWSSNILSLILTNLFILFMFFITFLLTHLNSRKIRINSPLSFYKDYIK